MIYMFAVSLGALLLLIGVQSKAKHILDENEIEDFSVFLDSNGEEVIQRRFTERHAVARKPGCECVCQKPDKTYKCCHCKASQSVCFPAIATVKTPSGDVIKMADLRPGQEVLTSNEGKMVKSKVVAFMKRNPEEVGIYMKIETSTGHTLALSPSHVIFTSKLNDTKSMVPRFSETVDIGDFVFVHRPNPREESKLVPAQVTAVSVLAMAGVYVPLTEHGTLLVDDIYTSCYASFDHHLAHIFMTPMRWLPWLFAPAPQATGTCSYVHFVKTFGRWILPYGLQDNPPATYEQTLTGNIHNCNKFPSTDLSTKIPGSMMTCSGIN